MRVAGIMLVRLSSQRCKRKNLRSFGNTNLTILALKKFVRSKELANLYFYAYEDELIDIAKPFKKVKILNRSKKSAYGEKFIEVHDYLNVLNEDAIVSINSCCPFFSVETLDKAVRYFKEHDYLSMIPAYPTYGWYFNSQGKIINDDENAVNGNSKFLKPVYKNSCCFVLFNRERALKEHTPWSFQKDDPHLFVIDEEEAFDIDTELDFKIAEAIHNQRLRNQK